MPPFRPIGEVAVILNISEDETKKNGRLLPLPPSEFEFKVEEI
jgi:hypothetical protein